jgi:mRNA-degrading endonuclease RelE of RelBE toxin-antitoxin system
VSDYSVQLTRAAHRDLDDLPIQTQQQIAADIKSLSSNPFPQGNKIKKLKGFDFPLFRLRSGDFRVLYRIDGREITLLRIIDRKLLDRILSQLK